MPALTSPTEIAKEGISHLDHLEYFGYGLVIFKEIGAYTLTRQVLHSNSDLLINLVVRKRWSMSTPLLIQTFEWINR